nr:RH56762p [Drosophila melanogaster]
MITCLRNWPLLLKRFSVHQIHQFTQLSGRFERPPQSGKSSRDPYLVTVVQGRSKKPRFPGERSNQRFGEDSWFVSSTPLAEVMGVADGVGGWRDLGVDAGRFAKELMSCCSGQTQLSDFDGRSPRNMLIAGFQELSHREHPVGVAALPAWRRCIGRTAPCTPPIWGTAASWWCEMDGCCTAQWSKPTTSTRPIS